MSTAATPDVYAPNMPPVHVAAPPELTVVVPCYNERPNVPPLVTKLDAALAGIA